MPDSTETEHIHSIQRQHRTAQKVHHAKIGPDLLTQAEQLTVLAMFCPLHACSLSTAVPATAFNSNMQHSQLVETPHCVA